MNIKNQIELMIAKLERENEQLKKGLDAFVLEMTEEKVDEVLDLISKNIELIRKLKREI